MEDPNGPGARFKDFYDDLNQIPDGLHALRQSYKAELYVANFFTMTFSYCGLILIIDPKISSCLWNYTRKSQS
jgi:hypothetical protein